MRPDAIAVGIAGVVFGLLSGWVIGSQQATMRGGGPGGRVGACACE
ncbi:MAG: hypothetical protein QM736_08595 [Vicinamibacterales bacterium]